MIHWSNVSFSVVFDLAFICCAGPDRAPQEGHDGRLRDGSAVHAVLAAGAGHGGVEAPVHERERRRAVHSGARAHSRACRPHRAPRRLQTEYHHFQLSYCHIVCQLAHCELCRELFEAMHI